MDGNDHNADTTLKCCNPRARKLRSVVWNDFTKEQKADGSYIAVCNHCKKHLTASSRSGTTHLKNHLGVCLSSKRINSTKRRKLVVRRLPVKSDAKDDGKTGVDFIHFDQDLSRQDLARMIVLHGYPFSIVQHVGFKTFIKNLQPQFKLVPYDTVKADCLEIYENAKLKLQEVLEKLPWRVSVSVDMWKSNVDVEYMCLTCHYIDSDSKLQRKILNFLHIESPSTSEEISQAIAEKLCYWNIDRKISSLVLDNCNFEDVVADELLKFLRPKGFLYSNGDLLHVHSCVHVLGFIVQDGLESVAELTNKVRDCMLYIKSSQARLRKFQNAMKQVGAPKKPVMIDVPTNWSSTYFMLETAYEFQNAFAWIAKDDGEFVSPSPKDWIEVKAVTECLEVFYQAIEKFSNTRIPTANLYFNDICGIHLLLKTWCMSPLPVIVSMAMRMLDKFEQHWGMTRTVMAIASILDPRYKLKSIEYFFQRIYGDTSEAKEMIEDVHKALADIYNEYSLQASHASSNQTFLCYGGANGTYTSMECTVEDSKSSSHITLSDTRRGLDQYLQETSSSQSVKSDLDLYLDEAVHPSKDGFDDSFNILGWWKLNAAKYPVLSTMAHDILGIPVSTVPLDPESRVLNQYLSSMDHITVQALICAQDWLRESIEAVNMDVDVGMALVPANGDEFCPL